MFTKKQAEVKGVSSASITEDYSYFFVVDLDTVLTGIDTYENYEKHEPGYTFAYFQAFNYALEHIVDIDKGLTQDYIKNIHKHAMSHKLDIKPAAGTYKGTHTSVSISTSLRASKLAASREGFIEFINKWLIQDSKPIFSISFDSNLKPKNGSFLYRMRNKEPITKKLRMMRVEDAKTIEAKEFKIGEDMTLLVKQLIDSLEDSSNEYTCYINSMERAVLQQSGYENVSDVARITADRIQGVITEYQEKITTCEKFDELVKLRIIAKCVQEINQIHPFADGNTRTCNILLNILLIKEGMSPVLLANPNRLDCFSHEQIVQFIREGQNYFKTCIAGELPVFSSTDPTLGTAKRTVSFTKPVKLDLKAQKEADSFFKTLFSILGIKTAIPFPLVSKHDKEKEIQYLDQCSGNLKMTSLIYASLFAEGTPKNLPSDLSREMRLQVTETRQKFITKSSSPCSIPPTFSSSGKPSNASMEAIAASTDSSEEGFSAPASPITRNIVSVETDIKKSIRLRYMIWDIPSPPIFLEGTQQEIRNPTKESHTK